MIKEHTMYAKNYVNQFLEAHKNNTKSPFILDNNKII